MKQSWSFQQVAHDQHPNRKDLHRQAAEPGWNAVLEAEKGASPVAETRNKDIEDQLAGTPGASGGLKIGNRKKMFGEKDYDGFLAWFNVTGILNAFNGL